MHMEMKVRWAPASTPLSSWSQGRTVWLTSSWGPRLWCCGSWLAPVGCEVWPEVRRLGRKPRLTDLWKMPPGCSSHPERKGVALLWAVVRDRRGKPDGRTEVTSCGLMAHQLKGDGEGDHGGERLFLSVGRGQGAGGGLSQGRAQES